jgi:two-component sensor histidine kinase
MLASDDPRQAMWRLHANKASTASACSGLRGSKVRGESRIRQTSGEELPLPCPEEATAPVIEPQPQGAASGESSGQALLQRVRQQEILAELGVLALKGTPFAELLDHTAQVTAEGLRAEFSKVLEYLPAEGSLLVRAGVGWPAGIVGNATVGADLESPAGFALRTGKPVISNHLENEERFRTPELLVENGIRRAMNVILQGDQKPYGVLEVDSRDEGEFEEHDIAFLQGAANLLGMAIERQRIESNLKAAVEQRDVLLQEIEHRVKNSLQLVISMLHLQASSVADEGVRRQLQEASGRIAAVARAHQRLHQGGEARTIELGTYLAELCGDLGASVGACTIEPELEPRILVATDRAIPLALIVTELVTNAAKYAYPGSGSGPIRVVLTIDPAHGIGLSVADDGVGLPAGFDPATSSGLGMRIARALAQQAGARLELAPCARGTEFTLTVPSDTSIRARTET